MPLAVPCSVVDGEPRVSHASLSCARSRSTPDPAVLDRWDARRMSAIERCDVSSDHALDGSAAISMSEHCDVLGRNF